MLWPSSSWSERLLWLAAGVVLTVGILYVLRPNPPLEALPKTAPDPPAPNADPAGGSPTPLTEPECYLGVVLAREAVELTSEAEGILQELRVRVGDRVERGEVIARLDTTVLREQLAAERANMKAVEARQRRMEINDRQAEQEHQRRISLNEAGLLSDEERATSRYEREKAGADLEAARAEAEQVRARIRQVETSLDRAEISAPFAGTVAQRFLDPGARLFPGLPVVRLITTGSLLARFAVPPERAGTASVGAVVRVEIETLRQAFYGTVAQRAPEIDAASQMVFIEARLQVAGAETSRIPSGATARVALGADPGRSCLAAL